MESIWEWIDKYGEVIIVSTMVTLIICVVISKIATAYRQMAEAMKLPNISGRGIKKYPEHNQNDVEHGDE